MTEKWIALTREAALAAEHMAIGVTALGKANYAKHAYYGQAFFALSIGLERSAKLILALDQAIRENGRFPENRDVRQYGHNLNELLRRADEVGNRISAQRRLPQTPIHLGIITILSEFAQNITRYYNLDLLTSAPNVASRTDPIQRWHDEVITAVLNEHYKARHRERDEAKAQIMDQILGPHVMVRHTSENRQELNSLSDASMQSARLDFARPYVRLYVLQIVRFVADVLSELGFLGQSHGLEDIPALSEFFAVFNNPDQYLKSRERWSIYPR